MTGSPPLTARRAIATLRRFTERPAALHVCDLCAVPVPDDHDHLLEPRERRIACACRACALLFPGSGGTAYLRLATRASRLPEVPLTDEDVRALGVPVRVAFLIPSRVHNCLFGLYPNAAGATESTLSLAAWDALVPAHPALGSIEPDVEALFVSVAGTAGDAFRVSVDLCHRVVGSLRQGSGRTRTPTTDIVHMLDAFELGGGRRPHG